ncbi:oligopeptide/dipeptide ABC transporter ATP-binding protein [Acetomicrobium sp. S15 = DSM 107314]|jgi:oligopeptide/dipeptide ABC transporter ATP-binding protein|uniref:oligopeptide/dipeptide ABC transporter ATP-binding protein n=1 Tax=Acetomicrobium sp. S15 = DSM 107314 TaxID=2529858 RepID=UPI0018E13C24|nr:ABC transporter ATP-binding protein [Acetomicrobium sp. S15 = DSM 107314]
MNAACVKNLRVFFGKGKEATWALHGIDFVLPLGGSLAIIGESGSGKTTLLRALLGLVAPSEGEALLFDTDLHSVEAAKRRSARRRCGYVAQDPYGSLPPTLSVEDAVAEVWQLVHGSTKEAKEKATSLLEELNIDRDMFKSSLRDGLSGGQRQRVAIARALVLEPELLLADEPTSMQDASTRWDVLEVLKRRIKKGMALLFVTHDLLLAKAITERGLVLFQGNPCEEGPSNAIIENPIHPYTKALASALPRLGKPLEAAARRRGAPKKEGSCPFLPFCPESFDKCDVSPPFENASFGRKVACWHFL